VSLSYDRPKEQCHEIGYAAVSDNISISAEQGCCRDYYTQHQVRQFEVEVKFQGREFSTSIFLYPEPHVSLIGSLVLTQGSTTITQVCSPSRIGEIKADTQALEWLEFAGKGLMARRLFQLQKWKDE